MPRIDRDAKVYVAGHLGLAGSAILRRLEQAQFRNIVTRSRAQLDLREQSAVRAFMSEARPRYVFAAAAKVGGILANTRYPAEFLYDNLMIEANLIEACRQNGTEKIVFLGSTCVYPKFAGQPIPESALLTGSLEATNEAYAIAKIAGLKLCEAYASQYGLQSISLMPTNLYGPGDAFDPENGHVLAALMHKAHCAKIENRAALDVWGTGTPLREFLHADDMADAALFCLEAVEGSALLNVGSSEEISIAALAGLIAETVGFRGQIRFDTTKPDGTPRKLSDTNAIRSLGWQPKIALRDGLRTTYDWYVRHLAN